MKRTLLSLAVAFLAVGANAADHSGSSRSGGKMYRRAPKGTSMANLGPEERANAVVYRPTQHFYSKDNIVSYRYSAVDASTVGTEYGGAYFGPHGAQFVPSQENMSPDGRIYSYASVSKRRVSGVPMVQTGATRGNSSSVTKGSASAVARVR